MFTRARLTRWTKALRANPEQQMGGRMTDGTGQRFCCLGKLCDVEGLYPIRIHGKYKYGDGEGFLPSFLEYDLCGTKAKSSDNARFDVMKMPELIYNGNSYTSAAGANDGLVPWPVIADHFDKYYPCSDEQ